MTQELVLVILLSGLLGLVWVMTLAIWEGKRTTEQSQEPKHSSHHEDLQRAERTLKHHSAAA